MQKWEYMWMYLGQDRKDKSKFVYIANGEQIEAQSPGAALNIVGQSGWELDEHRYIIIGESERGRVLIVSYTVRGDRTRLINARKVTQAEREAYEEGQSIH